MFVYVLLITLPYMLVSAGATDSVAFGFIAADLATGLGLKYSIAGVKCVLVCVLMLIGDTTEMHCGHTHVLYSWTAGAGWHGNNIICEQCMREYASKTTATSTNTLGKRLVEVRCCQFAKC